MANSFDGQNSILSVVGPISSSVGGLKLVTKALLSASPWLHDPLVHELPWREEWGRIDRLTFGVLRHDGHVTPTPPVRRAVEIVVEAMENLGHEVIEWNPTPDHKTISATIMETFVFDGGLDARKAIGLSGEPFIPQVGLFHMEKESPQYNATDIMRVNVQKREQQKQYMEYWNSSTNRTRDGSIVDCVIAPVAAYPAARFERYKYYGYTMWVNLLDYTSVVIPVTIARKELDPADKDFKPANEDDKDAFEAYDADIYDGTPVSIQLVGRRLQEEKMLAIAEYVSKALQ